MEKLVDGIDGFMFDMIKDLDSCSEDIREANENRSR